MTRDKIFQRVEEDLKRAESHLRKAEESTQRKYIKRRKKKEAQRAAHQAPPKQKASPEPISPRIQYLAILGMPVDTPTAIRAAYRRLALKYHPDKNPETASQFIRIHAAYEYLINNL